MHLDEDFGLLMFVSLNSLLQIAIYKGKPNLLWYLSSLACCVCNVTFGSSWMRVIIMKMKQR